MSASVLVVGAGPAGLILALSLLQNGVSVRIIDKEISHHIGERGAGMMPRTLELHNFLGTLPDILKIADDVPKRRSYELPGGTKILTEQDMSAYFEPTSSTPYSNPISIGQNYQEEILRAHIRKYGVEVELGTALEDLQQYGDHVTARLIRTTNGEAISEVANFPYLVGADGPRSVVRKKLGLSFAGESIEGVTIRIGDIIIKNGLGTKLVWHFWGDLQSKLVALRRSGQDANVYCFWIVGIDLSHVTITSGRNDLIKAIEEITERKDIEFGDIIWTGDYKASARMVDKFHLGRVFVSGDAAHCHTPSGAQGMNSSSQDSFNLGWKLALVVKGLAPPSLLDTYDEERVPVIAEVLKRTTEMMKQTIKSKDVKEAEAAWNRGSEMFMLGVNYRGSSIILDDGPNFEKNIGSAYSIESSAAARAGDRAPDASDLLQIFPSKEETSLFRLYGTSYHTVLVFGGSEEQHRALRAIVDKQPEGTVKSALIVHKHEEEASVSTDFDVVLVDCLGYTYGGYRMSSEGGLNVVVIRPDGVVGARVTNLDNVETYFSRVFL
ncbi:monooxygenase [Cyathus striatus]|nr:monooxygenase [Cyathus striatus]